MLRFLSLALAALVATTPVAQAASDAAALKVDFRLEPLGVALTPEPAQTPVQPGVAPLPKLFIKVVDGEGAVNNIRARTAREPVVEVDDENHKPVAGALVTFFVSNQGPGGSFAGQQSVTAVTDSNGIARGLGFHPNSLSGQFVIEVTATFGAVVVKTMIHESNEVLGGSGSSASTGAAASHAGFFSAKMIIFMGILAGGAAAGTFYAVHSAASVPTATITGPGTPTVGPTH